MSSKNLPREILIDILERLPAKSLVVSSSVCKSWYSLVTDPGFIASHLNQSKMRSNGYLLYMSLSPDHEQLCRVICDQTLVEHFNLAFPFDCESFKVNVAGSCNGVLCITDVDSHYFGRIVYLWNPSIRKLKPLPRSPYVTPQFFDLRTWVVLGLGFDHVSSDYKIVRLSYFWNNKEEYSTAIPNEIEVYTLRTNSWRRIGANVSCRAVKSSNAFVSGSIHWIAHRPKVADNCLILSFDVSNEVFHELMLPASYDDGSIRIHFKVLAELHGSLSFLIYGTALDNRGLIRCCYMWVMKKYGFAESWVKQFKFVVEEGICNLPGLTTSDEILYQNFRMEYFLCSFVNGRRKYTGHRGIDLVAYTESLVLLEKH